MKKLLLFLLLIPFYSFSQMYLGCSSHEMVMDITNKENVFSTRIDVINDTTIYYVYSKRQYQDTNVIYYFVKDTLIKERYIEIWTISRYSKIDSFRIVSKIVSKIEDWKIRDGVISRNIVYHSPRYNYYKNLIVDKDSVEYLITEYNENSKKRYERLKQEGKIIFVNASNDNQYSINVTDNVGLKNKEKKKERKRRTGKYKGVKNKKNKGWKSRKKNKIQNPGK